MPHEAVSLLDMPHEAISLLDMLHEAVSLLDMPHVAISLLDMPHEAKMLKFTEKCIICYCKKCSVRADEAISSYCMYSILLYIISLCPKGVKEYNLSCYLQNVCVC